MVKEKGSNMDNQKLENLLNLALNTSEEERRQSLNLNVGFEPVSRSWELIIKYNGNLERLKGSGIVIEDLLAGYAIATVPERLIDAFADLEEIEYIEKPKRLFFEVQQGKTASCVLPVTLREPYLTGQGVVIAVIDSGISYANENFRNADGSSRILFLWDQTLQPDAEKSFYSPEGFATGVEFRKEQLDTALAASTEAERYRLVPSRDSSGHGTAVAGIAAGNTVREPVQYGSGNMGRMNRQQENVREGTGYQGVAPGSSFIIVKLGLPAPDSFPRTTELMRALTYVVKKTQGLRMPVVINLSFGNTYGAHDGTSLLERFIDNVTEVGRTVICVGNGNEGASAGHLSGNMLRQPDGTERIGGRTVQVELAIAPYEPSTNVQLWRNYEDRYELRLHSPGGETVIVNTEKVGKQTILLEETRVLIYVGNPTPYAVSQEIYFDFLPVGSYVNPGVWRFELIPVKLVTGDYFFYLPSEAVRNRATRFYAPTPQVTLTIPSTARKVISVGAYNSEFQSYADFSGRGYTMELQNLGIIGAGIVKPDIAAPGVDILAPDIYGGYQPVTGTSFATPFVSGAAALLMEWGIIRGNDPFLYGEKVKAYLRKGAGSIRGEQNYPNPRVGYGALCVADSLPM